jgi:hypothetical protein
MNSLETEVKTEVGNYPFSCVGCNSAVDDGWMPDGHVICAKCAKHWEIDPKKRI